MYKTPFLFVCDDHKFRRYALKQRDLEEELFIDTKVKGKYDKKHTSSFWFAIIAKSTAHLNEGI